MAIATPAWVRDAVFYQIFPDRFARSERLVPPGPYEPWDSPPTRHGFKGGDLYGIAERLDYLADLGVTALYLNPIFSSASNHRYHTFDYFEVDPLLGGDQALDELLHAAHGRGMRVILDGAFNHSGRGFWPFHHVLETGGASPYREWFYLDEGVLHSSRRVNAYPSPSEVEAIAGEAATTAGPPGSASRRILGYEAWWDLPALPKLNVAHPAMREYLLRAAEHWVRRGIDGWRLDVPEEIADVEFWREFRQRVKALDPEAYIVAEIWHVAPDRLAGDQFDATMNYPLGEAILGFVGAGRLDQDVIGEHGTYSAAVRPLDGPAFARRLEELLGVYDPAVTAVQLNLIGSHDLPRFVTMCGGDRTALRLATLIQMTLPGAPCLYYGDEIGLEGRIDPGCRGAFPWARERWDEGLRESVRRAIALRQASPALRRGALRLVAADAATVAYSRSEGSEWTLVVVNAGDAALRLQLAVPEVSGRLLETVAAFGESEGVAISAVVDGNGSAVMEAPARSGMVLR